MSEPYAQARPAQRFCRKLRRPPPPPYAGGRSERSDLVRIFSTFSAARTWDDGTVTVADRVLELLRVSHAAYDDDELARRLDVEPRQAINQACRRLAAEGRLRRYPGPEGKIVNEFIDSPTIPASGALPEREAAQESAAVSPDDTAEGEPAGQPIDLLPGLPLATVLADLAEVRPLFHSEADFQLALAWQIKLARPDAVVRLETRPFPDESVYLDLLLRDPGTGHRVAVELKYPTRLLVAEHDGEAYRLRDHAAHDVLRHDVVKDVHRVERCVDAGAADAGWVMALTNEPGYWTRSERVTIDAAFRLHEGRVLEGTTAWSSLAGPGTTARRNVPLALRGRYPLTWHDYSQVGAGTASRFRYLAVPVAGVVAS